MTPPIAAEASKQAAIAVLVPPAQRKLGQRIEARFFFWVAGLFWVYIIVNTFVYSIDAALIKVIPTEAQWAIRYKLFFFVAAATLPITIFGRRHLAFYALYIAAFPVTRLVFSVIFVLRKRSWALLFVIVNYLASIFSNMKAYFLQCAGVVAAICLIWLIDTPRSNLAGSLVALATAVFGLGISFRTALRSASLVGLFGRFFSGYRNVMAAQFQIDTSIKSRKKDARNADDRLKVNTSLDAAVFYNRVCLLVARRLRTFQNSSWHLLPAAISVLGTYLWIGGMFSLVYLGLFRFDAATFQVADGSFFSFFYFSMSALFFGTATDVAPISSVSQSIYLLHRLLILFIGIIFVTEIVSFGNQRYSEALDATIDELERNAKDMEEHICVEFEIDGIGEAISALESEKSGLHGLIGIINRQIE
jgi:hypothetical protein